MAPPGLQTNPLAALEVRVTLPPVQKVVGPEGVTVGVTAELLTVTTVGAEVAEQPNALVTCTV